MLTWEKVNARRYVTSSALIMAAYCLLLGGSLWLDNNTELGVWKYPVMAVPMVPLYFLWPVFRRFMADRDEMWQKIYLEAMSFTFGITLMASLTVGLMQFVGLRLVNLTVLWPFMCIVFAFGVSMAVRRHSR